MDFFYDYDSVLDRRAEAEALIIGDEEHSDIYGRVSFYSIEQGVVISVDLVGLPRGTGQCDSPIFAFHIHDGELCTGNSTDPFANAGTHYNPNDCQHPYHAGDFPPLFGANGNAFSAFLTDRFSVDEVIGKTVIIHSAPDDFVTQPSGNPGEKIACGIITPVMT